MSLAVTCQIVSNFVGECFAMCVSTPSCLVDFEFERRRIARRKKMRQHRRKSSSGTAGDTEKKTANKIKHFIFVLFSLFFRFRLINEKECWARRCAKPKRWSQFCNKSKDTLRKYARNGMVRLQCTHTQTRRGRELIVIKLVAAFHPSCDFLAV